MSRTVRRRHGLGRHEWRCMRNSYYGKYETLKALRRFLHSEKYEPMNDPGWWTHMMNTKPERVEVRRLTQLVMKTDDLEDAPLFPEKRPHIYYW